MTDETDPAVAASQLEGLGRQRTGWPGDVLYELPSRSMADQLGRVQATWQLTADETTRMLGVTPQALGEWRSAGIPAERAAAVADLAAATDLLVRHLRADRIPAVVRRSAERLGGRSLLNVATDDGTRAALEACRAMFDFPAASD